MPNDPVAEFLRAEEEANRLADVVRQLKDEVGSYKTAHDVLGRAAEQVGALAARSASVAQQLGLVAETLRSIGTPELIRRMDSLGGEVIELRKGLQEMRETTVQVQNETTAVLTDQIRKVRVVSIWSLCLAAAAVLLLIGMLVTHG